MAVCPSVRLPASVLRKPEAWIGLWGALRGTPASRRLCASWTRGSGLAGTRLGARACRAPCGHALAPGRLGPSACPGRAAPPSVRLKSNVSSGKPARRTLQPAEADESEEDESEAEGQRRGREVEPEDEEDEEERGAAKDYKDLEKAVPSLRYDVVLKTGLDIGRNKVEDAFYKGELRLNGQKLWKKSRTVKVGDALDLVLEADAQAETVMRVVLRKVLDEKTDGDRHRVALRRWKRLRLPGKPAAK